MPGAARIGREYGPYAKNPQHEPGSALSSTAADLLDAPQPELLGTIDPGKLNDLLTEAPPPPWETDPRYRRHNSDARLYVSAPDNWSFRWLSESMIRQNGMRNWEAVSASDPRVTVHNKTMVAPDNTIRKGDHRHGDILCWMWTAWVDSRNAIKAETVRKRAGAAVNRAESLKEEARRGSFGRGVSVDSVTHPTHTQGEGRSMKD